MKTRDEILGRIRGLFEHHQERGAKITDAQREFLEEASWQSHRRNLQGKRPRSMTNAQRKMKHDMMERWREGLENLFLMELPLSWGEAWLRKRDLEDVLDFNARLALIRLLVKGFGRDFGDMAISELQGLYSGENERILVVRGLDRWGP